MITTKAPKTYFPMLLFYLFQGSFHILSIFSCLQSSLVSITQFFSMIMWHSLVVYRTSLWEFSVYVFTIKNVIGTLVSKTQDDTVGLDYYTSFAPWPHNFVCLAKGLLTSRVRLRLTQGC